MDRVELLQTIRKHEHDVLRGAERNHEAKTERAGSSTLVEQDQI